MRAWFITWPPHTQLVVPAPQVNLRQPQQQEGRDEKEGEADDKLKEGRDRE